MEEKIIWWDNFEDCPTMERETIAPPERYTEVLANGGGGYLEIWSVTNAQRGNCRLQIAYPEDQHGIIWVLRTRAEEEHHCKLVRLIRWYVPEYHYNMLLSRLGLSDLTGG